MSYDLMVFDPETVPREKDAFRAWYDAEIAAQTDASSGALSSPSMRSFYEELREVFTPLNGTDAVMLQDDASQARILRTADYDFRPQTIYMAFRWPAQDFARATCSTYAKHFELGLYNLSGPYPQVRFPDGYYLYPVGNWKDAET